MPLVNKITQVLYKNCVNNIENISTVARVNVREPFAFLQCGPLVCLKFRQKEFGQNYFLQYFTLGCVNKIYVVYFTYDITLSEMGKGQLLIFS